jgi:hypothetical protein
MRRRGVDMLDSPKSFGSQRFATGVAGVKIVPELNVILVLLPTEENFFAADESGKID